MKLFKHIAREFDSYEKRRDEIIRLSRDVLRNSKNVIFLCHEGKVHEAKKLVHRLIDVVKKAEAKYIKPLASSRQPFDLYSEGSWCAGVEEFLEGWFMFHFMEKKKLVAPTGIHPPASVYVGALSDFTGEILRLAVLRASEKDVSAVERFRHVIAEVIAFLTPLHMTGQGRMKFDAAKRNLKRIEEILYEVKIRT